MKLALVPNLATKLRHLQIVTNCIVALPWIAQLSSSVRIEPESHQLSHNKVSNEFISGPIDRIPPALGSDKNVDDSDIKHFIQAASVVLIACDSSAIAARGSHLVIS